LTRRSDGRPNDRVRAFDGLRGLAVVAVLLFHSQLAAARGGFLGVSAFFTLSGYLITSLLLAEHTRTNRISLRAFWIRRGRRLLPAAYVALAGILAFGATIATVDQARALRGDVLSALTYVANWHFYLSGRSYAHLFTAPSPVLHFWSLAIEEQFYLAFPLLLFGIVLVARGRRWVIGGFLAAGVAASVVAGNVLLASSGESRVYYGTDTRAAELLIGALLAVVFAHPGISADRRSRTARVAIPLAGAAALAAMIWWWMTVDQSDRWLYRGGFALHACLTAVVIACARVPSPLSRALSWRPLVGLGIISYGVYLFHWPIFLWLSPERTGLSTVPLLGLRFAVTLVVALASYAVLEQPVLRGRVRLRGAGRRLLAPITAAALVAVLLAVTWSPPPPEIVLAALGDNKSTVQLTKLLPTTTTTRPHRRPRRLLRPPVPLHRPVSGTRPLRIMVVGDSVALTLGRGFELWARAHRSAIVDNAARMYCPLGRGLPAQQGFAENFDMSPCDWTRRWPDQVATFDPDVVVVLFTVWEIAPRQLPGSSTWSSPGDAAFDRWQLGEYGAAADTLAARGAQVVWMTAPCEPHFDVTPGSPLWLIDHKLIPQTAAQRRSVHVLDLSPQLCPHGAPLFDYRGVHNARPDGAHYSDRGALAVADWAMPIVLGQAPLPPAPRAS
jgi:peptidoglycan/LPS O-acetylase OafA/YrhL